MFRSGSGLRITGNRGAVWLLWLNVVVLIMYNVKQFPHAESGAEHPTKYVIQVSKLLSFNLILLCIKITLNPTFIVVVFFFVNVYRILQNFERTPSYMIYNL